MKLRTLQDEMEFRAQRRSQMQFVNQKNINLLPEQNQRIPIFSLYLLCYPQD